MTQFFKKKKVNQPIFATKIDSKIGNEFGKTKSLVIYLPVPRKKDFLNGRFLAKKCKRSIKFNVLRQIDEYSACSKKSQCKSAHSFLAARGEGEID